MNSNSSLQTITSEAKANVSEIDLYEAISSDILFWEKYGISVDILNKYKVNAISDCYTK